jgi:hypothetical protein
MIIRAMMIIKPSQVRMRFVFMGVV